MLVLENEIKPDEESKEREKRKREIVKKSVLLVHKTSYFYHGIVKRGSILAKLCSRTSRLDAIVCPFSNSLLGVWLP